VKQIAKLIILVIFTQSISLGAYAIGWSFEDNDTVVHASHTESQIDTKLCDKMMECDNNCYDCCHCVILLKSPLEKKFASHTLNNNIFSAFLNSLPDFLYKPPRISYS